MRPPNFTDFTAELGVSRRTVARDLDFLRDKELESIFGPRIHRIGFLVKIP